MEIFAKDFKVGDKVNCHCDGWLIIKDIKFTYASFISALFNNGTERTYDGSDRVFVIR